MDKEIMEEFKKRNIMIEADKDSFDFRCTCCGVCCRNREDILLNAYDVMRIQKYLKIDFGTFMKQYGEMYIGSVSTLPVLRIRPRGKLRTCPFLFRNKCSIHEVKPVVCALFPVGRFTCREQGSEIAKTEYFVQKIECGAKDIHNDLKEWVKSCISEYDEQCGQLWIEMMVCAEDIVLAIGDGITDRTYDMIANLMYCGYEKVDDFQEEIKKRIKVLKEIAAQIKEAVKEYNEMAFPVAKEQGEK